jgi:hypothetical protein
MNAVSTSIDGMSGDFSTTNPACCTRGLRTSPMRSSDSSTCSAAVMLAEMLAVWEQIEQHALQYRVLVVERDPALEVGRVLALGQPARGLTGGAAIGQHVHRRPDTSGLPMESAWMENEQVGLGAARAQLCVPAG